MYTMQTQLARILNKQREVNELRNDYRLFLLKQSRIMDLEVRQYRLTTAELIDSGFRRDGNGNWRAES